jgi:hypothetical protein
MSQTPRTEEERAFEVFAGWCAIAIGAGGLVYSITFVTILRGAGRVTVGANSVFLLLGGLLSTAVLVALYRRLRDASPPFALWALLLGILGAAGAAIHGGYNLANAINPPRLGLAALPNAIDPRGLLTFGVTAVSFFVFVLLIFRSGAFPRGLAYVGYAAASLSLVLYLGRLVILDPEHPLLLGAAALAGFVANPAWYVWLGIELRREPR